MRHTFQQIIKNQNSYRNEIKEWLKDDFKKSKKILKEISSEEDEEIKREKQHFYNKIKSIDYKNVIESLFFSTPRERRASVYAWWDENENEVIIYEYKQKSRKNIDRLRVQR